MYDNLLTIQEVGRILDTPWRRVSMWVDSGRLQGTRTDNTFEQQISTDSLNDFIVKYGIEFGLTSQGKTSC
jgi:hypothetical protein